MIELLTDRDVARFWSKVNKTSACWLWTGWLNHGYGYFHIRVDGKPCHLRAHRVSFVLAGGNIPEGLVLDHKCCIQSCVNPSHLRAVTQRVNVLVGKGPTAINAAKTHCPQGHAYTSENTRVTPAGDRKCRACARDYSRKRRARAARLADGGDER